MKLNKDIANAGVFVLFALAVLFLIPNQIEVISDSAMNARFVPTVVALALLVLSTLNLVIAVRKSVRAGGATTAITACDLSRHARPWRYLVSFLYALTMEPVGFEAASIAVEDSPPAYPDQKAGSISLIVSVFSIAVSLIFASCSAYRWQRPAFRSLSLC